MSSRPGIAAAVAHGGVLDQDAAVDARTRQRQTERARHRRFRPAGVGRAVTAGVAHDRPPGAGRGGVLAQRRGRDDQQRGQARGRQIDQVVEPRRRIAEVAVTRRAMADHAVGGVDRLVGDAAGKPANRQPENRRHDAVGEVLRQALDRRARDAGLIERLGIAADDLRRPPRGAASMPSRSSAVATRAT